MVTKTSPASSVTTWYSRDAQGNVMSVYEAGKSSLNDGRLTQTELHLYGSSRLGLLRRSLDVDSFPVPDPFKITMPIFGTGDSIPFGRGNKLFELSNHLGNVLVTVNDKKLGVSSNNSIVDYFNPQVMSAQDYYPFGMLQVGRSYNAGGYRYGFNGKENDNEVKGGLGNQQDYGFRIYDPRIGKFLSVDPLTKNYPFLTPYAFAENDVISSIDLDGLEKYRIVSRSFAPRWAFRQTHFEARADDRTKFELADFRKASARIHTKIELDLNGWELKKPEIYSQPTISLTKGIWPVDNQNINAIKIVSGPEGMNFGPGIDIQFTYDLEQGDKNTLNITSHVTGNNFPAQESMIFDEAGTGLFLGTATAQNSPLTNVWGKGEGNILYNNTVKVQTDKDGKFIGVYSKDKKGNEIVISPAAYNKKFTDQKVWSKQDQIDDKTGIDKRDKYMIPPY